jgi:hypothetical protein
MITPEMLTDTVIEWFNNLDYEYMVLHTIVCYGLYYSKNMKWIVNLFSSDRDKGLSYAIWVVGGLLAVIEVGRLVPYLGDNELILQKIVSIGHSYIVIQVFVESIVKSIHKWVNIFNKKNDNPMNS